MQTEINELDKVLQKYGITDPKDLDLQLSDAQVFYQVGGGKASAGALMTCFLRMWPKETMDRVAKELINWLTATGYLQTNLWAGTSQERDRISLAFIAAVEKLCAGALISKQEWIWYEEQIGAMVAGNRSVIEKVAAGDFSDIEQFFAQVHGRRAGCVAHIN